MLSCSGQLLVTMSGDDSVGISLGTQTGTMGAEEIRAFKLDLWRRLQTKDGQP